VIKEPTARAEQVSAARFSLAHADSVSVRWPRSLKPLLVLGLLVGVVLAAVAVIHACNSALVRAPGVLRPAARSALRVSFSANGRNACRVAEVYKQPGEAVQAGEKLLRLGSASEEFQLEQAQKRVQSCLQRLKDYELRRQETQLADSAAGMEAKQKVLESDLEKARLEERRFSRAMEDRALRAPISGVLYKFHVQSGDWVSSQDTLGWVCDTSSLVFQAQVTQRDSARVRIGQRARVYFSASSGGSGLYEAEVAEIGEFLEVAERNTSDPLGLFPLPLTRTVMPPQAMVRLKVLGAVGCAPDEISAGVSPASTGGALRPGGVGQARILVGDGKLAEWFFNWRPYSAATPVHYAGTRSKGQDLAAEPAKKKKKS